MRQPLADRRSEQRGPAYGPQTRILTPEIRGAGVRRRRSTVARLLRRGVHQDFIIGEDLVAGRLVPVLPGYRVPELAIHAVYPHGRHLSAKVRSFVDFLLETWRHEDFATLPRLNSGA